MEQFESEDSSTVQWARYDADSQTLEIDFRSGKGNSTKKTTYEYKYFPVTEWVRFQEAPSKGTHFAKEIKPKYKGVKIPAAGAGTLDLGE